MVHIWQIISDSKTTWLYCFKNTVCLRVSQLILENSRDKAGWLYFNIKIHFLNVPLQFLSKELRKYKENEKDTEVLMSALSAMQDKTQHLENSLSAETRIKLDLFSALGDAKRQLEIAQGNVDSSITNGHNGGNWGGNLLQLVVGQRSLVCSWKLVPGILWGGSHS